MRIILLFSALLFTFGAKAQFIVTANDTDACLNQTVVLQASGMDEYMWSPATNLDTNAGAVANFASATAGSYTFTVFGIDTAANDTDTVSITIQVYPNPTVVVSSSAAGSNNFVCIGQSATLTASGANLVSFLWSPNATLNVDDSSVVIATPTSVTTYVVTATDAFGCTATQSKLVNVTLSNPTLVLNNTGTEICPGQSTTLTADGGGLTFLWSPAFTLSSATTKTVTATPTTTTTYSVTASTNGCSSTASVEVVVLDAPSMTYSQSSNGAPICLDQTDVITVTCAECVSYIWNFPNSSLNTPNNIQTVSPNNSGAIPIVVFGLGSNDCKGSITAIVNVDSCFIGTPFSIDETSNEPMQLVQRGSQFTLTASNEIDEFVVYNLLGETVYQRVALAKSTIDWNADLLNAGLYIVVARSGKQELSKKIYLQ